MSYSPQQRSYSPTLQQPYSTGADPLALQNQMAQLQQQQQMQQQQQLQQQQLQQQLQQQQLQQQQMMPGIQQQQYPYLSPGVMAPGVMSQQEMDRKCKSINKCTLIWLIIIFIFLIMFLIWAAVNSSDIAKIKHEMGEMANAAQTQG